MPAEYLKTPHPRPHHWLKDASCKDQSRLEIYASGSTAGWRVVKLLPDQSQKQTVVGVYCWELVAFGANSHSTVVLLCVYSSSSHKPLVNLGKEGSRIKTREERGSRETRLLLQTPPAEAHWLASSVLHFLTGFGWARPSAAQPDRRGGDHRDNTSLVT